MSAPAGRRPAEAPICPLLGLLDDQSSRFSYSSVGHRCYADGRPRAIDLSYQGSFCLVPAYTECPRYRAAAASRPPGAATPEASWVATERVGAEAGAPGASGEPGRQPLGRTSRWRGVLAIVIAVAVLAGAAYLASPAIGDWMRQVGAGATPTSTSPSTPPLATPAPTPATPARTPTTTRAAIPSITPTPAAATSTLAATPLVHVVVKGETLIAIAARYGVTVSAIMNANGITDAGLIYVDERLVIPSP